MKIGALIDTGSEITCISEEFYDENKAYFKEVMELPVRGVQVMGAIGRKSGRIKKQIFPTMKIGDICVDLNFTVVPGLIKTIIVGTDTLDMWKAKIDYRDRVVIIKQGEKTVRCPFKGAEVPSQRLVMHIEEWQMGKGYVTREEEVISTEEIESSVENIPELSREEKAVLAEEIKKRKEIFKNTPGKIKGYSYKIEVKEDEEFHGKCYTIPLNLRGKAREAIKKLLLQGIIEKSTSRYISPLVCLLKKDNSVRLCMDARAVNKIIKPDYATSRTPQELFQECANAKIMTSLDLTQSFYQIELHPQSRKYCAFTFEGRIYQFTRVPFGCAISSSALVRALDYVLGDEHENFCLNFVDDLLIISRNLEEHFGHLARVLDKLKDAGITMNFKKVKFCRQRIEFLGHEISTEGITIAEEKFAPIRDFPRPRNRKQMKSFLGLINYFARFHMDHAKLTSVLNDLTRKDRKWEWNERHQQAFEEIKEEFCKAVMLHHPDPKKPYYIQTDASGYAIASRLYQKDDKGEEKTIYFASRCLRGAELTYSTTLKELIAIIHALGKYRSFILGAKTIVISDHKSLSYLFGCKLLNTTLARWILSIQEYNIEIKYCRGKENIVADVLSRHPYDTTGNENFPNEEPIIALILAERPSKELEEGMRNIKERQRNDPRLQRIIELLENGEGLSRVNQYRLTESGLTKEERGRRRICIPEDFFLRLISETHEMYGHPGAEKLYSIINEQFTYPKCQREIRKFTAKCEICQRLKAPNASIYTELQTVIPKQRNDLLCIDLMGPFPKGQYGHQYILSAVDGFSKYIKFYPMRAATTKGILRIILKKHIPAVGRYQRILTDRGTQFTSPTWVRRLEATGIKAIFCSVRHPQGNQVERYHRTVKTLLRIFCQRAHNSWVKWLPVAERCMNDTRNSTIEVTPTEAHFGHKPERIWHKWLSNEDAVEAENDEILLTKIREHIAKKGEKRRLREERKHKGRIEKFEVGDLVLIRTDPVSNKERKIFKAFLPIYEGPYGIKESKGSFTFLLIHPITEEERGVFHVSKLKRYQGEITKHTTNHSNTHTQTTQPS